jgi:hypothetical protein
MKNYTLREIQELSKKFNYKYISLLDQNNKVIIPQNKFNKVDEKYKEIFDYLETPDISNIYFLSGKNSISKNVAGENYLINLTHNAPKEIIKNNPLNLSSDFTQVANHPAVKMQQEINRLMLEIERKDEIIENLENEVDELIKLKNETVLSEQEQPKSNFENAQQFLSQMIEFGAPLLDQHFQIKKDAMEIEKLKYANGLNQRRPQPPRPQPRPEPAQKIIEDWKIIKDWINSKATTEPENFNKLKGLYENSNNHPQFRDLLQQNDLELLNEFDEL